MDNVFLGLSKGIGMILRLCAALGILLLSGSLLLAQDARPAIVKAIKVADLGLVSRAPTKAEISSFKLVLKVRYMGQVISEIKKGGAAEQSGLKVGDAIIRFGNNGLYSYDDVKDYVATSKVGQKLKVEFKRKGSSELESLSVMMLSQLIKVPTPRFPWEFSSLAQLETALSQAKAKNKPIMIGISGAET